MKHGPRLKRPSGAGFSNINIDLMYGLPGQTVEDALSDLAAAASLEPAHISWYQLTIEPNTVFHAKPPSLPGDDLIWEMQTMRTGLPDPAAVPAIRGVRLVQGRL